MMHSFTVGNRCQVCGAPRGANLAGTCPGPALPAGIEPVTLADPEDTTRLLRGILSVVAMRRQAARASTIPWDAASWATEKPPAKVRDQIDSDAKQILAGLEHFGLAIVRRDRA